MASKTEYALQIAIGGKVASSFKRAIKGATSEMSTLQKAAVAAIAAIGKELVDIGTEFDNAYDAIRVGTGATGEELAALETSMNNVYAQVPASMEDTATAISDYNTRLGVTGETLETLSTQVLQASDMLGEDLTGMIESSSQAMQQWGVAEEDMADSMDYVFKVSQATGTDMNTLFSEMQTYGAQMQDMGYSFEEAAALMGQLDKAGVNTTEVLGAMKKSVTTMAKDGISASEGLEMYCEQIKNASTEAEAAAIASEVFGARAGSTMANAIRDGTMSVEDFTKALEASDETIGKAAWDTYDFPEQLEMMKHQAEVSLQPLASELFSSLSDMMPMISDALGQVMPVVTTALTSLMPVIQKIFSAIDFDMIADVISILVEALAPVITQIAGILPELIGIVSQIIEAVAPYLPQIFAVLGPIINAIMTLVQAVLPPLLPILQPIMDLIVAVLPIITAICDLITGLSPVISTVVSVATTAVSSVISVIVPVIESITGILQGIVDFISNVFAGNWAGAWEGIKETFAGVWDAIVGVVKGAVNLIIRCINAIINAINTIKIGPLPDWKILGEYAGAEIGFNIPNIPELATGGIVTEDTIARIGEGSEPEAVVPLSKLSSMINGGLGGGDVNITFSPVINCETGDPRQIEEATEDAFEQFQIFMDRYLKQNRRVQFSHA